MVTRSRPGRPKAALTDSQATAVSKLEKATEALEAAEAHHTRAVIAAYKTGVGTTRLADPAGLTERATKLLLERSGVKLRGKKRGAA